MDLERAAMVSGRGRGRSVGVEAFSLPPSLPPSAMRRDAAPFFLESRFGKSTPNQENQPTDTMIRKCRPTRVTFYRNLGRAREGGREGGNGKNKRHRSITRKTVVRPSVGSLFFRSADRPTPTPQKGPSSSIHSTRGGGLDARPHKKNTTAETAIHPVARNDTYQK